MFDDLDDIISSHRIQVRILCVILVWISQSSHIQYLTLAFSIAECPKNVEAHNHNIFLKPYHRLRLCAVWATILRKRRGESRETYVAHEVPRDVPHHSTTVDNAHARPCAIRKIRKTKHTQVHSVDCWLKLTYSLLHEHSYLNAISSDCMYNDEDGSYDHGCVGLDPDEFYYDANGTFVGAEHDAYNDIR